MTQVNVCIANKQMQEKQKEPTQNKNNIGTIALEQSVVYTMGGGGRGLKAFHCTNLILGSDIILNTKTT